MINDENENNENNENINETDEIIDDETDDETDDDSENKNENDNDVETKNDSETEIICDCPICKDILIIPRLYECGHSVCEKCMIGYDNVKDNDNAKTFDLTEYACPVCRHKTIKTWSMRPINHQLISILEQNPRYVRLSEKYKKEYPTLKPYIVPKGLNLSYIAHKARIAKAHELYNELLPLLYDAAIKGKPRIIVTTNIKEYRFVADILAKLLYSSGIKRFFTTPSEVNIDIISIPTRSWRFEYNNPNYNITDEWLDVDDDDIDDDPDDPDDPIPTPTIIPLLSTRQYIQEFPNLIELANNIY